MYQQPLVNVKSLKFGSVKVEISNDGINFITLGTGDKAKFSEKLTTQDINSDNGGLLATIVKDQTCEVSYTMKEIDLNIIQQMRGGIDGYSTVAGTAVSVTGEALGTGWTQGKPIKLANQNGNNNAVSSITIKAAGTALVAGTDYRTYVGDGLNGILGATYIVPITTQSGVLTADYSYTPNAAVVIKTGGNTTILSNFVRLTNTNAAGKKFQITVYKAQNSEGIGFDFPGDDEGKNWDLPVKFSGSKDANRAVGDQLFTIYNEQI